jgi:hypothetical protein
MKAIAPGGVGPKDSHLDRVNQRWPQRSIATAYQLGFRSASSSAGQLKRDCRCEAASVVKTKGSEGHSDGEPEADPETEALVKT